MMQLTIHKLGPVAPVFSLAVYPGFFRHISDLVFEFLGSLVAMIS